MKELVIGTRGSKLALAQTNLVVEALKTKNPEWSIQVKTITTKGDVNQAPIPVDTIGKAWFTEEIEQALLKKEIDLAIHSLKDLPPEIPDGLATVTILKRADPRDVLISKISKTLKELPAGAVIGTDSIRRKMLILEQRPDVTVTSIRGNVDTRLKKLATEHYDAIVLAAAGLGRVGMLGSVTEFLNPAVFIPAIGQGILAAQVRKDNVKLFAILTEMEDINTRSVTAAEQAFAAIVGGGCKLPIGAYARIENGMITIDAVVGKEDLSNFLKKTASGPADQGVVIAEQLAREMISAL
jgi:hydroxymethylbilane synthase